MAIDITTHPQYEQAKARYDGSLAAARSQSDPLAEANAEREWAQAQATFYQQAAEASAAQSALDAARAQARVQFPMAPEASYSVITDPAALLAAAQATHEAVTAAGPPAGGTPPPTPPAPGTWPTPPVGGTPVPPRPDNPMDDPATYRETLGKAINGPKSSERHAWENPDRKAVVDYALDRIQRQGLQTVMVERPHNQQRKRNVEW